MKCAMCGHVPNNTLRPQASSLITASPEKDIDTTSKSDERYHNNSNILGNPLTSLSNQI